MKLLPAILLLFASNSFAQSTPLAEDIKLSYYDSTRSSAILEVPFVNGSTVAVGMGQRFTHPNELAYLDSVRVHFDAVDGDKLLLVIFRDTIVNTGGSDLHYANTGTTGELARLELELEGLLGLKDFWHTIPIPHVKVPKDFHVMLFPIQTSPDEFSSKFWILGAMHVGRSASSSSRSDVMITSDLITYTPQLLDGFYTYIGNPLGIDLHMDAFVDVTSSSVAQGDRDAAGVHPNPAIAGHTLTIKHSDRIRSLSLVNTLGAEVRETSGLSTEAKLQTTGLARGVYTLLITTERGVISQKIIVQ